MSTYIYMYTYIHIYIYIYIQIFFGDGWFGERHKSCKWILTAQTATEASAHKQKAGKMLLNKPI